MFIGWQNKLMAIIFTLQQEQNHYISVIRNLAKYMSYDLFPFLSKNYDFFCLRKQNFFFIFAQMKIIFSIETVICSPKLKTAN